MNDIEIVERLIHGNARSAGKERKDPKEGFIPHRGYESKDIQPFY